MNTKRYSNIVQVAQIKQVANRFVLMSFLLAISFLVLFLTYLPVTVFGSDDPIAEITEKQYDFGEVADGSEVSHDFLVKNRGAGELIISEVKTG
ncbi:MAG: DUF1573 domain-containing protein [Desulfobulbaceae bacterium]|nr:DUF1573 domain-containing protein [Desulfobulbaceae bacterium]